MSHIEDPKKRIFLIGMILSMFCWGLSWASGKILSQYGDVLTISFYRFALTFVSLLFILIFLKEKFTILRLGLKDLICASCLITLYTYFFFKGLSAGMAGAGGVLVTILNPVISYLAMLLLTVRRPTQNEFVGICFGLLAGSILLQVWVNWTNIFTAGNSYFLLASFTWAMLSLFTAKAGRYGSSMVFSFWMYGISTLILLLISSPTKNISLLQTADFAFWANLFFSATITTAFATTFFFMATSKLGASKASSFIFLVPFTAAMGSWVFLNETPRVHTIIGGLIGIAAVYVLNKKTSQ
ncbi:MAG TPA: DMT family transporter [Cytophagaceae bacterium]|jgi:drug/metabolite transporter (DMT)-like permease